MEKLKVPMALIILFLSYHVYMLGQIDDRVRKEVFEAEKENLTTKIMGNREIGEVHIDRIEKKIDKLLSRK